MLSETADCPAKVGVLASRFQGSPQNNHFLTSIKTTTRWNKKQNIMGGRGAYDPQTESIPIERREYKEIGQCCGMKILEGTASNGKSPVISNTANTAYAIYSNRAGRIKQVCYYDNHILVKQIDLEGAASHWHQCTTNPLNGEIGRTPHDYSNSFPPTPDMWVLIHQLEAWHK